MSSILLNYIPNVLTKKSVYNSNITDAMDDIEKRQIIQARNRPEYLTQFDDLKLDNKGLPTDMASSHSSRSAGINTLQRDLDFSKGYSQIEGFNSTYNVVSKDDFTHNNMAPSSARRDNFQNYSDRSLQKLEQFTGVPNENSLLSHNKKERVPLFEPMQNLSWTTGMPTQTNFMQQRYVPSNKNNNANLPFQNNVRVVPGLNGSNQQGVYSVYRVNPRDIDATRSKLRQQVTYQQPVIQSGIKGHASSADPVLTKFKVPDYREITPDKFVPNKYTVDGPKQTGQFTNVQTQRNMEEFYYTTPAVNTTQGSAPNVNTSKYTESNKQNFFNDPTHAINAAARPVMTNSKSYSNDPTQRATMGSTNIGVVSGQTNTSHVQDINKKLDPTIRATTGLTGDKIGVSSPVEKSNYILSSDFIINPTTRQTTSHNIITNLSSGIGNAPTYNEDQARPTIKQNTSHNIITNLSSGIENAPIYNEDQARTTIKQGTSHNIITNLSSGIENAPIYNEDQARTTIKQGTSHNIITNLSSGIENAPIYNEDQARPTIKQGTSHNIISNLIGYGKSLVVQMLGDTAKPTIKQTTSHNIVTNPSGYQETYAIDYKDVANPTIREDTGNAQKIGNIGTISTQYVLSTDAEARPTIKETTLHQTPEGRAFNNSGNYSRDEKDIARNTIRQTTEGTKQTGPLKDYNSAEYSREAVNNVQLDDRRQISVQGRIPNGGKSKKGPDMNNTNVELNEPVLYSHTPNPVKAVNWSDRPNPSDNTYSRPVIDNSTYYISSNRVNTLKNNPYVNDIYHQKNFNY